MQLSTRNARRTGIVAALALTAMASPAFAQAATPTPSAWVTDLTEGFQQLTTDVQSLVTNNFLGIIVLLGLGIGLTVLIKMGGKAKTAA